MTLLAAVAGCTAERDEGFGTSTPWAGLDDGDESTDDGDESTGDETSDGSGAGETTGGQDDSGEDDDTTGAADTTGASDDTGPVDDDVPQNAYCEEVADWNPTWAAVEEELLVLVNQARAQGADCGQFGSFGPAGPLTMHPALRCAARKHSKDMHDRGFFDHTNPDGENGGHRMGKAGYTGSSGGENIAYGLSSAQSTMGQWMGSDGHCSNIMKPSFKDFGGGYYAGGQYGHLWTQVFGVP